MGGWVGEWMSGCRNRWVHGWVSEGMGGCMDV